MTALGIWHTNTCPPSDRRDWRGGMAVSGLFGKVRGLMASGRQAIHRAPGPDAFDNDDARAWTGVFASQGAPAVEAALEAVLEAAVQGHVPIDVAHRGMAAAEAVAFAYERRAQLLGQAELDAMSAHAAEVRGLPDIRNTASRAMIAVAGKAGGRDITSDLAEKWRGTGRAGDAKLFMAKVRHLAMRVKG